MIRIFLSVSVPLPSRDPVYFETADVLGIREAVKGLVSEVVLHGTIVFGGHPAITPLIALLLRDMGNQYRGRVILYQSEAFKDKYPPEKSEFLNVIDVPAVGISETDSLQAMRERMIYDAPYDAGVFIGGMEGVELEFNMFREAYHGAPIWPVASTGAAARRIFDQLDRPNPDLWLHELTYSTLFRRMIRELPLR
ncbi:SLOG domain-containing protein [Rhizobium sp. SL86]|uniref:SLOG domain-containing protein n=1 Tax=Rhizobium sp. SL86 TaxID=2995148 RepID=UPI00227482CF|nr:hypothetical protein [Rhizobium sp. SL86]MCY1665845.1 hypothetical protein [Rhizobium sp. SL86]